MTPAQHRVLDAVDRHAEEHNAPCPAFTLAVALQAATAADRERLDHVVAGLCQHELLACTEGHHGAKLALTKLGTMALNEIRKGRKLTDPSCLQEVDQLLADIKRLKRKPDAGPELLRLYLRGQHLLAQAEEVRP